jgi:ribose-phosphate pyrophosphokinase
MGLPILAGSANVALAEAVAARLDSRPGSCEVQVFPDGELYVEIQESVRGEDVYFIQPTSPPVEKHLLEVLLLADGAHRAGAVRLAAVIPYFSYARQDRRVSGRARLVADLLESGGLFERVVAVDVHTDAVEGFFGILLEHLSAVPMLLESVRPYVGENCVVVVLDMGVAELAERYAEPLGLPVAVIRPASAVRR